MTDRCTERFSRRFGGCTSIHTHYLWMVIIADLYYTSRQTDRQSIKFCDTAIVYTVRLDTVDTVSFYIYVEQTQSTTIIVSLCPVDKI